MGIMVRIFLLMGNAGFISSTVVTNTILGVPWYDDGLFYPKTLFKLHRPLY